MQGTRRPSRQLGFVCIAVGVLIALFCAFAETLGIGGGTFGWKQVVGVVVGCLIALAGLFIVFGPSSGVPDSQ